MTDPATHIAGDCGTTHLRLHLCRGNYGVQHLKALRAVLPRIKAFAVGGVGAGTLPEWSPAGIDGIAFGSEIYALGCRRRRTCRGDRQRLAAGAELEACANPADRI